MIEINLNSSVPIEEQIRGGFHQLLFKGQLKPGDMLPEPFDLAAMLHVSPAMVSRAYKGLHQEGFLEGSVVSAHARGKASSDLAEVVQELFIALEAVRKEGLTWEEVESIVQILRTDDLMAREKIIPTVFKRLYFDWKTAQNQVSLCPYCREGVKEDTVSCLLCKTLHHKDCWEETGHCSVFGCKGKVKLKE
jgi:GntR family transcriptional regulator